MTTVHQAISAVMGDVREVRKAERNQVQGFNFRGIDAVMNAVGPVLRKHGVFVVPNVESCEYSTVVIGAKRTEMGHAQLIVAFTWYGPEGDSIVSRVAAEAMDSGDKAISKAHSVAMRTAMIQTLALPTDEQDPDEQSVRRAARAKAPTEQEPAEPTTRIARERPAPPPARDPDLAPPAQSGPRPISPEQIIAIHTVLGKARMGADRDRALRFISEVIGRDITSTKELTSSEASTAIDAISRHVEKS